MTPSLRLFAFALVFSLGCSAPERANRAARCSTSADCSDDRICYRGFCVEDELDDGQPSDPPPVDVPPANEVDASEPKPPPQSGADSSIMSDPPKVDASQSRDAGGMSEASVPAPERDAEVPPARDAAQGPTDPRPADASTGPGTPDAMTPPPPPRDAAAPNNNDDLQRDLGVCLVRCRNNEAICYNCFRRIVQEHPEVCTDPNATGVDALVQNLCGLLCPTPMSCSGGPR